MRLVIGRASLIAIRLIFGNQRRVRFNGCRLAHAMDKDDGGRYKVGDMLLDLKNPEKILHRAQEPILEPDMWYENDWKPGIVYANGAVVKDGKLLVYYGGGDKYIGLASISLSELLDSLKKNKVVKLTKQNVIKVN